MKKYNLLAVLEYTKIMTAVLFAMAAGIATYHQYLMQNKPRNIHTQEVYREEIKIEPVKAEKVNVKVEKLEETEVDIEEEKFYDDLEFLALCVEAEAGNQSLLGKRMVVDVILNRVEDEDFPNTIAEVIMQPYQFSTYWNGSIDKIVEPSDETIMAVRMELEDQLYKDIYFFTAGDYSEYGTPYKQVGEHYFSKK